MNVSGSSTAWPSFSRTQKAAADRLREDELARFLGLRGVCNHEARNRPTISQFRRRVDPVPLRQHAMEDAIPGGFAGADGCRAPMEHLGRQQPDAAVANRDHEDQGEERPQGFRGHVTGGVVGKLPGVEQACALADGQRQEHSDPAG
jgi:hypothetical protein